MAIDETMRKEFKLNGDSVFSHMPYTVDALIDILLKAKSEMGGDTIVGYHYNDWERVYNEHAFVHSVEFVTNYKMFRLQNYDTSKFVVLR